MDARASSFREVETMKFKTRAIHAGQKPDPTTGAIMPPVYLTSTYVQESPGETKGYDYTRAGNPNFTMLESLLASLEQGRYATVFSSGIGAETALLSTLKHGDKVVAIEGLYGGTYRLFSKVFSKFGIEFHFININDIHKLRKALEGAQWLFFETPTNPLLGIIDIESLSSLAKEYGVRTIVDNTFASPFFQNPLLLGANAVLHSTTKYIGGHSDTIGGVIITNDQKLKEELDFARKAVGLNPSPFDAWLTTRGVKTLALRMEQHQKNATAFVELLQNHPLVKKVYYPGLETHPDFEVARKQMSGYSGIVTIDFKLSLEQTKRLIASFKYFALAESLGGVESLVSHPASMTHASIPADERARLGLSDSLVRFSLGIEATQDLLDDVEEALDVFM